MIETEKFIERLREPALRMEEKHGVPAPVIIAQGALESGWGRYMPPGSNNLFGIKHHDSPEHDYVVAPTHEHLDGEDVPQDAKFRKYDSWEESVEDHSQFLRSNSRYSDCFKTSDPAEFARRLQEAGYATDPEYAQKLISIMRGHDLQSIRPASTRGGEKLMLSKIKGLSGLARRIYEIVSFALPFLMALWDVVVMVESEEDEEDRGSEEERSFVLGVLEVLYDLANELTEEEFPVSWEKLEEKLAAIYEKIVWLLDKINFFRGQEGGQ